jgi:ParB/RepB/Spo0J family partition protein
MKTKMKKSGLAEAPVLRNLPMEEQVPASQFVRYPENRVPRAEKVEEMRKSIEEVGQLSPVLARGIEGADGERILQIVAGETRWRACGEIHENFPVRCFILDVDDREAARLHAIENFQRVELDAVEQGRALANMRAQGWSVEEMEDVLGVKKTQVYKLLRVAGMSEPIQTALREGNVSLDTVDLIASLPEERRELALQAVVEPKTAARALPQREAMALLHRDFVEPMRKEEAWNERRRVLEKEFPEAEWVGWPEVVAMRRPASGFEAAGSRPGWHLLCDAARVEEMVVPTWGELAERHGVRPRIGVNDEDGETACLWVCVSGLVEAEIARHDESPSECVFSHPKAVAEARTQREAARAREEAMLRERMEGLEKEHARLVAGVMQPGLKSVRAKMGLVRWFLTEMEQGGMMDDDNAFAMVVPCKGDVGELDKVEVALAWLNKNYKAAPFEGLGRLMVGMEVAITNVYSPGGKSAVTDLLSCGWVKAADFPMLGAGAGDEGEEEMEGEG